MRTARDVIWAIGLGMVMCSALPHEAAGQQPQADFRQRFISSYVAAAIRHGRPAGPAEVQANCIYGIIATQMTVGEAVELADEERSSQPPAALAPFLAEIRARCFHGVGPPGPMAMPGGSAMPQPVAIDDADSAAVAREFRRLRVSQEARLSAAAGEPVMLPTGVCTATVTVGSAGQPVPGFPVRCRDMRMQEVMRQAVATVAPLIATPGSVVRLVVVAPDPEPGADH